MKWISLGIWKVIGHFSYTLLSVQMIHYLFVVFSVIIICHRCVLQ